MNKKKKVALLCNFPVWLINSNIPCRKGHYAVWLLPLYEAFASWTDWEIHWITLSRESKHPVRFEKNNQHFHVLPCGSRMVALYTLYLRDRAVVRNELRKVQPDIIHTWGTEGCYGLCGKDYCRKAYWLHSVQGLLKAYMQRGSMPKFQRHHSIYEPRVLKSAPYITTESPWAAERVKEINPAACPILWDYAVEERFTQIARKLSESPCFLYCGNDTPIKNLQTLITAFASPQLSHVRLLMAGPTPENYLNLPGNITALGRVNREDVVRLLSETWGLVHLSKADTGPTAVKEARVMGVPVILTTECGAKKYIENGKSGFVVQPHDVPSVIQAVLTITQSQETSLHMGNYDRENCCTALSANTMSDKLHQIYTSILHKTTTY